MAKRSKALLLLVVMLIGGWCALVGEYWLYGAKWVAAEGSPYGNRGIVTDRNGILLRDFGNGGYSASPELRRATVHWVGDMAGNIHTPVLDYYKSKLMGYDVVTGLYSTGGQSVGMLTVSSSVQKTALEAMDGRRGTVAVYNYETGAILCALSAPGSDPLGADGTEDGRYMNRFLQGLYTPGSIFKIVTAGAALENIPDILQQRFVCNGRVEYGNGRVTCERAHGKLDLYSAMAESCNTDVKLTLKDAKTLDPISWASVYLIPDGDTIITHFALSDDKGDVRLKDVPVGKYEVNAEIIGYNPHKKTYTIKAHWDAYDLGIIKMEENPEFLESIGDSIVCVADDEIVKIHVHTNDPGLAIQKRLY